MRTTDPVIIVGGGPVGLCLGLHLAQAHVPFVILEEDAELSSELKAGTILPSSLEIFAQLGVADAALGAGVRCSTVDFVDRRSGRLVTQTHLDELATETRFPLILNLAQPEIERILFAALKQRGLGDTVRFGSSVTSIEQDADGCTVTVESPQGLECLRGVYVVGCDGGRSRIRRELGIELLGRTYPETFSLFNVRFASPEADGRRAPLSFVFDPDEWLILARLPHCWRVVWPLAPDRPEPTVADLRDRIGFAFGDQPFEVVGRARYNVHHRYASRFRVGRVFLAGDAAHLMTPVGGLGLNTGFQDVNNLAWKLARVIREAAGASLLDTYQDERQSVARAVASHLADRNRTQLMLRSPLRRAARNALAALQARSGRHRWHVAHVGSLLGVKYGIQSTEPARLTRLRQILLPEARPPVRHGHRAPDGSLHWPDGHEGRLHDLLGQDFVALTFCDARRAGAALTLPDSVPVAHYVISPTDAAPDTGLRPHLLLDAGGRLRARFGAEDMTTYVLRPDGWVLAAGPHATIVRHISQTLHTFLSSSPDRAEEIMLSS